MKKILTPVSSNAESLTINNDCRERYGSDMQPKADTLERIRMFARVAFSDAAIASLPLIVLN